MKLLILTYHYVGAETGKGIGIHPVSSKNFVEQLETIGKRYKFISEGDLVEALANGGTFPNDSCMLTFDDGLKCQFDNAVPILAERGIPAVFFIPTLHLENRKVYMTHRVHLLLEIADLRDLLANIEEQNYLISGQNLVLTKDDMEYIKNWYIYDNLEIGKIKFIINHRISVSIADKIIDRLFQKYYPGQEEEICNKYFMFERHIESLLHNPIFSIGLHSHSHLDMARATLEIISSDIRKNHESLRRFSSNIRGMSYPYGIVPESQVFEGVKDVASDLGIKYGVTTKKGINIDFDRFLLKRMNPNDVKSV